MFLQAIGGGAPVHAAELTTQDLKVMATDIATRHNLNVDHFLKTVECESSWSIYAKGDYINGVPTSFGLVQLHYPTAYWGIPTSTAYKPATALEIMATAWDKGQHRKWSCWVKLYG